MRINELFTKEDTGPYSEVKEYYLLKLSFEVKVMMYSSLALFCVLRSGVDSTGMPSYSSAFESPGRCLDRSLLDPSQRSWPTVTSVLRWLGGEAMWT